MSDTAELSRTGALPSENDASLPKEQAATEGMFDWDLNTDNITFAPRWKNMLGYQDDELENHLNTWKGIVHPDDLESALNQVRIFVESSTELLESKTRLRHKNGHYLNIRSVIFKVKNLLGTRCQRLLGYHIDNTQREKDHIYNEQSRKILEMIAIGLPACEVYNAIARLYEHRYPGMRCLMLELEGNTLLHGGAPSLPRAYCDAVNGLKNGPEVGSCGSSTYFGKRVLVENIETDSKWANIKQFALPHGMRCCWSEPIKSSTGKVLGAFGMYYNYPALPTKDESQDLTAAAMLAGLVMERDHTQKQIRNMAFFDDLTGLHSRGYGQMLLKELLRKSLNTDKKFAVLHLDLDNFKSINGNFGHEIGDIHLKEIAKRLVAISNGKHIISRLDGDQFSIIIPEFSNQSEIEIIVQSYLESISQPILVANRKFIQNASFGISLFPKDSNERKSLGNLADIALCYAKKIVKNSYVFYSPEQTKATEYRFKLEQLLKEAIANGELSLVYQAKTDFRTGKVNGLEVLCRWYHPELGQVSPIEFIDIAEQIGIISALTEYVMENSFSQFMKWKATGLYFGGVAINISPSLFIEPDFISLLEKTLSKTGMHPENVELEITESFSQTEKESLLAIERLKAMGVNITIDDFGKGYSCFASLRQMEIDILKIDKLFIDDLAVDSKAKQLVKSMIEMAHALGCKVVAEGIESMDQLQLLRRLGCDFAQGYLLNRPTPPEHLPKTLADSFLL